MESTSSDGQQPPSFLLTPQQQNLLLAALNVNKAFEPGRNGISLSPNSFSGSPQQNNDLGGFQESPYLDNYDYDFGADSSFDYSMSGGNDGSKMNEDVPATDKSDSAENEGHEKRSHPDDDDEGSPESSNGKEAKRRESTEKVPKKPGRKPLTSEPTSKRKAQNRAAQRAFRERKEKHLKDLENKVLELEKSSEAKGTENAALRAKIESMTAELNEYKNKVQLLTNSRSLSGTKTSHGFGHAAVSNLSDVNFHFEFPKFGMLPGPPLVTKQTPQQAQTPVMFASPPSTNSNPVSPSQQTLDAGKSLGSGAGSFDSLSKNDLAQLSSVFGSPAGSHSLLNGSRASLDSGRYSLGGAATSSPSASSNSNVGASSSCGTSPEPFTQSPMGSKPVDTMTTIGEEQSTPQSLFDGIDVNAGFDWLAQQNGGQFDPQLFGDYREPQESILANTTFDESFFNEALDADFFTPYNMPSSPAVQKKSLVAEIEAKQGVDGDGLPVTSNDNLNCAKIWEKLQNCPKVQNGEFDLDSLCTELQKKAKCSGKGPVVQEQEFTSILKKYLGKELAEGCKDSFSS